MSRRAALLLRASVIWTAWVWIVLIRNMIIGQNMSTTFRLTQIILGIVSIAFAVVTWQITSTTRRFTRVVERERRPAVERKSVAHRAGASVRRRTRGSDAATLPEASTPVSIPVSGSRPFDSPD
jgi:hypothetical protein